MTASQWSAPRFVAQLARIWVFTLGALLSPAITIAGEVGQEPLPHGWIGTVDDWARGLGIAFAVLDLVLLAAAWVFLQRSGLTALLKQTLFVAIALLPLTVVFFGYQYGLEASKTVDACGAWHVMGSHVRDLRDPTSETLAAVHYKNRYIQHDQCYTCHSDYGMFGTLQAKWDGLGHVVRELTRTYTLPLKIARAFPNSRCLYCHGESQKFSKSAGHGTDLMPQFRTGAVSCLDCHGPAHPLAGKAPLR